MTTHNDWYPVAVERADRWMRRTAPVLQRLATEDPRLAAVLGGAMVEDLLRNAINVRRAEGSDEISQYAPASAVRSTAFQFGLILKHHNAEIKTITEIRNKFAHSVDLDLDFESSIIERFTSQLQLYKTYDELHPERSLEIYQSMGTNRGRWFVSVCGILTGLRYLIEGSDPIEPITILPARIIYLPDWFTGD